MSLLDKLAEQVGLGGLNESAKDIFGIPELLGVHQGDPIPILGLGGRNAGGGSSGGGGGAKTDLGTNDLDALMNSAYADAYESLRTKAKGGGQITADDWLNLQRIQSYQSQKPDVKSAIQGQALTNRFNELLKSGNKDQMDTFMTSLQSGPASVVMQSLIKQSQAAAGGTTGIDDATAKAAQEQQDEAVRMGELNFQRGAFMDMMGTFPEKVRGQIMLTALQDPTVKEMFFPKFSHTQYAAPTNPLAAFGPGK